MTRLALPLLLAFGAFSFWVLGTRGVGAFDAVVAHEPWALQMLIDLVIACSFAIGWMVRDARRRQITVWPFVVATVVAGSLGLLAYVVRRERLGHGRPAAT